MIYPKLEVIKMLKLSDNGYKLIKKYEGCRLKAYKPVQAEKYWTIGWGHYGADVKEGQVITQQEADDLLKKDMAKYENSVNTLCDYLKLNQNEFDALVSFCYNCGSGAVQKITQNKTATKEQLLINMSKYVNGADGKQLLGLVRRRNEEKILFLTPVKEAKMFDINQEFEALEFLESTGRITNKKYWEKALEVVHNLDWLIIKWANDVEKLINQ